MALARVSLVENQIVVRPFGSELLTPLVSQASGYADAAAASAVAADASADASAASAAAAATSADTTYVELEYVQAASWETANKYFVRPIRNVSLTGTLTQYRFRLKSPFDNVAGSLNWHIVKYGVTPAADGTITAGDSVTGNSLVTTGNGGIVSIRARNGVDSPAAGDITQYSVIEVVRNPNPVGNNPGSALGWRIEEPSDRVTANLSRLFASLSDTPQYTSPLRPVRASKVEDNTWFIDVMPDDGHYTGDEDPYHGDASRYVLFDYGDSAGIESAPTLNSFTTRRFDQWHELANHTVTGLDSGNPYNTGHSPSTVETVLNCGIQGGAAPELSGRGHFHETADEDAWDLRRTKQDASTGFITAATKTNPLTITMAGNNYQVGRKFTLYGVAGMTQLNGVELTVTGAGDTLTIGGVDATGYGTFTSHTGTNVEKDSVNLATYPVGTVEPCIRVTSTWGGFMQTPGGTATNAFKTTYIHEALSDPLATFNVRMTMDPTDAGVTENIVVRDGSYACMAPFRNATRLQPLKINPATGAITEEGPIYTVDLRNGSQINMTVKADMTTPEEDWNAVRGWHHRRPTVRKILRNNAGAGYTHWSGAKVDANRVERAGPWFYKNETWGTKAYDHIFADATSSGVLVTDVIHTDFSLYDDFGDDLEA